MTLSLRRYQDTDASACWSLFHRAVQIGAAGHYDQAQRDAWSPAPPELTPERRARLADALTWVAFNRGMLAGFMSLEWNGHLDMAFVAPEFMGRGVAGALLDKLEQEAADLGLDAINTEASHMARSFFARRGWDEICRETITRNGVALDRFRMIHTLKAAA